MLFNLLTQKEEFRLLLSYRESYIFTNQSFCSSKHCFILRRSKDSTAETQEPLSYAVRVTFPCKFKMLTAANGSS